MSIHTKQDSESPILAADTKPNEQSASYVDHASAQVKPDKPPRRTFSKAYKLKILDAYDACDTREARGALLRKEGLYSSRITTWKKLRAEGKLDIKRKPNNTKSSPTDQQLTRENAKLKKKLAQAEAIIDIQKKVSALLGDYILPLSNDEMKS